MIPVAVLDTNILVSAAVTSSGNEAGVFRAARNDEIRFVWSELIEVEYNRVLYRPKFDHLRLNITGILAVITRYGRCIDTEATLLKSPDPSDTPFIDCAMAANADYLITGNKRHFPESFYGRTEVLNARQLLERIASTTP